MIAGVSGDLRHSFRNLLRSYAFTIPAVAGLALSIGATTAVFSIVHTLLVRSQGFTDADRIVTLWQTDPKRGQKHVEVSFGDMEDWRKQSQIFEDVALASSVNLDFPLLGDGEPQQVDGTTVSGAFFRVLGARPAVGRLLNEEDDRAGAPLRLVISHRLWRTRYGGEPGVVGRQIRSGETTATIIGVTAPEFDFPRDVDLFVALRASWPTVEKQPRFRVFRSVARLKPGVSVEQAQAQMNVAATQIERTLPPGAGPYGVIVTPLLDEIYGPARLAVRVLLAAVFLVLLIACANVANLLLARGTVRNRELALRSVLGASRKRLIALLMTESVVLAVVSGALGLLIARAGVTILARMAPPEVPRMEQIAVDGPVLLFGMALSVVTVLVFGLGPALIASRRDPNDALRQGGRTSSADRAHTRLRSTLMAAEVALSVVLLVGSGLLIRSFQALANVDPGFRSENVLTFRITTNTGLQEKRRAVYSEVIQRVKALPGVESAAAVLIRPLSGLAGWDTVYAVEGQSPEEQKNNPNGNYEAISPDYFRTMGIRMLAGRDFADTDTEKAQGVVILNESTAKRHFGSGTAVGRHLRLGTNPTAPWLTVVGVVSDVRYREWEAARPDFYIPYTQRAQHRSDFVVRTSGDPASLIAAVRREVFAVDPNQPISNVTTMEALVDRALSRSRFISTVLSVLAACALALAAIGIYGVLSYTVAQRTGEIGVRMAIGATPASILRLVTGSALRVTAAGAVAGLALAAALARTVSSLLFGIQVWDPFAWTAASGILFLAAAVACVVPAVRASAVDPARALATE